MRLFSRHTLGPGTGHRRHASLATTIWVLCAAVRADAASGALRDFDLDRLTLSAGAHDSLMLNTGDLLADGAVRLTLAGQWQRNPLLVQSGGTELGRVISSRASSHLLVAWSPQRQWELALQLPTVVDQRGDDLTAEGIVAPDARGLGTPWLQARFGALSETRLAPVDLAVQLAIGLPLGTGGALAGNNGLTLAPQIGVGKVIRKALRAGGEIGFVLRPTAHIGAPAGKSEIGQVLGVGLGLHTTGRGVRGEVVARGLLALGNEPSAGDLTLGARYSFGQVLEGFSLMGRGIGRMPGTPSFRVLLGVSAFFPRPRKRPALSWAAQDAPKGSP